jgi:subtilisin-like proprotein convertase family protein
MNRTTLLAMVAGLCAGCAPAALGQISISSGPINIPINDFPSVSVALNMGLPFVIGDLNVRVNIVHTFDGDLDFVLLPPGGTEYIHLASDVGGGGDNFTNTVFDDQAATSITAGTAPFTGSFRPEGGAASFDASATFSLNSLTPLANLGSVNGRSSLGSWTLVIDDDAAGDVGALTEFTLIFQQLLNPLPPTGVATLTPSSVAAGGTTVATVQVTPGANPPSTGLDVSVTSPSVFSGVFGLFDNGVAPDATAGDNIFSGNIPVDVAAQQGANTLTFTINDLQNRSSTTTATLTVTPPAASNDLCFNAITVPNSDFPVATPAASIVGNAFASESPFSCVTSTNSSVWYAFTAPESGNFQFSTSIARATGNNVTDTVMALYGGTCGSLTSIACDDDSGDGNQSQFTANLTADETYFIQVAKFGASAPAAADTLGLWIDRLTVPPSVVVSVTPSQIDNCQDTSVLIRATVTPGSQPASTNLIATADIFQLPVALNDEGFDGDEVAGDNVFTSSVALPTQGQTPRQIPVVVTVFDAEDRTATSQTSLTLTECPPANTWFEAVSGGGDAGELPATAQVVAGSSGLSIPQIRGTLTSGNDVDMFQIDVCDIAFAATTFPDTGFDTQLFLFNNAGFGVVMNDDVPDGLPGDNSLQSRISSALVPAGGTYYLAVSRYDTDPQSSGTDLWLDSPFNIERAPDGPAAANAVNGWTANAQAAGNYVIALSGACAVSVSPPCTWRADTCFADYNDDGGIDGDDVIAFFADWDSSNSCADTDNSDGVDGDDVIAFFALWDASGGSLPGC